MKHFFRYIGNLFYNFSTFLYYLLKTEKVNWYYLTNRKINCVIDKRAKIAGPCNLSDISAGFGTYIAANSSISNATIGKFCSIGPNFLCGWGIHPIHGISTSPIFYSRKKQCGFTFSKEDKVEERKAIKIGNDVFIGANVTVLDGVVIGDGAVIGAGAVVNKDVPAYALAVGCPIRIIKYRFGEQTIKHLLEIKWWDKGEEGLRQVEELFFEVESFTKKYAPY